MYIQYTWKHSYILHVHVYTGTDLSSQHTIVVQYRHYRGLYTGKWGHVDPMSMPYDRIRELNQPFSTLAATSTLSLVVETLATHSLVRCLIRPGIPRNSKRNLFRANFLL